MCPSPKLSFCHQPAIFLQIHQVFHLSTSIRYSILSTHNPVSHLMYMKLYRFLQLAWLLSHQRNCTKVGHIERSETTPSGRSQTSRFDRHQSTEYIPTNANKLNQGTKHLWCAPLGVKALLVYLWNSLLQFFIFLILPAQMMFKQMQFSS